MKKKSIVILIFAILALASIGVAAKMKFTSVEQQSSGVIISGEDSFGRSFKISGAHAGMIDTDGDATIVVGDNNTLRFEEARLLIDGYVSAPLNSGIQSIEVDFLDFEISVKANGKEITRRKRVNPAFTHTNGSKG